MPVALIITTAGINCDLELAEAFTLAGASAEFRHLNELLADPFLIDRYDLIGFPGGFCYGDAVAAGRIAAQLMRRRLYGPLVRAVQRGVPMIAPCNGFQILVQVGLLPGPADGEPWPETPPRPTVTLAHNTIPRLIDDWVRIEIPADTRCLWTRSLEIDDDVRRLPIAHGEGRFIPSSPGLLESLEGRGQVAVRYAADDNPNGSIGHVAGICDASGLILGLMPHPERYTRWTHHPFWTRLADADRTGDPPGLRMFQNAVAHAGQATAV